jgi:hypothetical protein
MGQHVVALMWGISSKTYGLRTPDGDWLWDDFSGRTPKSKRLNDDDPKRPRSAYEGGVLGFPVAAGPACNDDEGFLGETCALEDMATTHARHLAKAKKRWATFAAWLLKKHGKTLPPAALWLTTDERA